MPAFLSRLRRAARRSPLEATLALAAALVTLQVILSPLAASRYVPMTDLPFHVAQGAVFRHYWDPSCHFHEQFVLRPLAIPYMAINALVASAMLVLPPLLAIKVTLAVLLMMVPGGLALLFHGAKKSPLLGLLGLGMCWGNLTHWGFVNYVAALGLFSGVLGVTLLVLDRPTRGRKVALALLLVALFFTHIFRFPFAVAGVIGTAVVMYPATGASGPSSCPLLPSLLLFAVWWVIRPPALTGKLDIGVHLDRFPGEWGSALTGGFTDDGVKRRLLLYFNVLWGVAGACAAFAVVQWRRGTGASPPGTPASRSSLWPAAPSSWRSSSRCRCGSAGGGTSTRARRPPRSSSSAAPAPTCRASPGPASRWSRRWRSPPSASARR